MNNKFNMKKRRGAITKRIINPAHNKVINVSNSSNKKPPI